MGRGRGGGGLAEEKGHTIGVEGKGRGLSLGVEQIFAASAKHSRRSGSRFVGFVALCQRRGADAGGRAGGKEAVPRSNLRPLFP